MTDTFTAYQNALTVEALQSVERTGIDPLAYAEEFVNRTRINHPNEASRDWYFLRPRLTPPEYRITVNQDDSVLDVAIKILEAIQK